LFDESDPKPALGTVGNPYPVAADQNPQQQRSGQSGYRF
jgi:hypothetical protein